MIKQTWEISNDERNRILSLHESATKNFYLMSEQDSSVQGVKKVFEIDENYTYWLSQVSYSRGGGYVDWTKNYFIFAKMSDIFFSRDFLFIFNRFSRKQEGGGEGKRKKYFKKLSQIHRRNLDLDTELEKMLDSDPHPH